MRHLPARGQDCEEEQWDTLCVVGEQSVPSTCRCLELVVALSRQQGWRAGGRGKMGTSKPRWRQYDSARGTSGCSCATTSSASRTRYPQIQSRRLSSGILQDWGGWCTCIHAGRGEGFQAGCELCSQVWGKNWLHANNMLKWMQAHSEKISGPTGQHFGGLLELVPTLVCSDAHPDMDLKYAPRLRLGWPSLQQVDAIRQLPMLLVMTGDKYSDEFPMQARFSWRPSEMILTITLPLYIKQVYVALKYAFKCLMRRFRGADTALDGRSNVGSFHLKMVFLRHLEANPPTSIWSQSHLMRALLHDLKDYILTGNLPHYFLPECNLLQTVGPKERRIACNVIEHILSDPIRAILTCPTNPCEIYGEVQPDALAAAFSLVISNPTSESNGEDLLRLLRCLDGTRRCQHQGQLEQDVASEFRRVSGRVELSRLVDMLLEQIQN